ncbi:hypothetical protein [Roseimaritima sediminicola]|uniref:hypothetical protein n=1 Tax=Roseimaritima sediminicola TaxID=2662066 RepID=UPI0013873FF6|nr:hypothetical protein [Roseimaritima sediminicola]
MEDFPSSLSGCNAQGLLAAWTTPWHPALIARSGKIPTWCRADVPPAARDGMLLWVPEISEARLPHDFAQTHQSHQGVQILRGGSREAFLNQLPLDEIDFPASPLEGGHRPVAPEDFFALAYVFLQVQLMTRQLRYTSNLDEVHFSDVLVAAAKAFVAGDGAAAADSLHQAFDLLSEERDHYFSSDPHLVDLTLLAATTLGRGLEKTLADPHPSNLLLDAAIVERLAEEHPQRLQTIRERFQAGTLGLAGGAPDSGGCLDHLSVAQIGRTLADAKQRFTDLFGRMPDAFASYSGGIPADLAPWLASLGYTGTIPINFAAGSGYRDEHKLLWQAGSTEMEALVAKPIDAADDAEFLKLGATLGGAVDAGDVATALLVHWPGRSCRSFDDLRRAAGWGLALGKFWTLGGYFTEGEKPYHSFQSDALAADGSWLESQVRDGVVDPLSRVADDFREQLRRERDGVFGALAELVSGDATPPPPAGERSAARDAATETGAAGSPAAQRLADALYAAASSQSAASSQPDAAAPTVLNPHPVPLRVAAQVAGHPPPAKQAQHVFAGYQTADGQSVAFLDVPAFGFATCQPGSAPARQGWFRKPPRRAEGQSLANEFLDVVVADDGSIGSVHSGPVRGNRFSWQLCHFEAGRQPRYSVMQADKIAITHSDATRGEISCEGRLLRGDAAVGSYRIRYRIEAGSRWLEIDGEVDLARGTTLGPEPWQNYIAGRSAVASEAARTKVLLRDKVHRVAGRRLNAPLGVLIDEADRQTLVVADGRPAHRVCGSRMLDTIVAVAGQQDRTFRLRYGFDVKSPVAVARSLLAPPEVVAAAGSPLPVPAGWLLQLDARNVIITEARCERVDGALEMVLLVIETRGKPTKTRLHCYRNPQAAWREGEEHRFECEEDAVKIVLGGFESLQLRVRF